MPLASLLSVKQVTDVIRNSPNTRAIAWSIEEVGVIEPLIVYRNPDQRQFTTRYANLLPLGMQIRVTNPKAMGCWGNALAGYPRADDQLFDLELIKRKYSNMMDILP